MIQKPGRRLRLIAGGDVMLGRQMPGLVALHGAAWPLAAIATQLRAADLVLVNLEVCLAMNGDFLDKGGRQPYYYHAPPAMLDVLTAVGVNCLATANNHAMDYGPEAMVRHCEALDAAGFAYAGTGRTLADAARPAMVRVDGTEGLTVAFISVETETPDMQAGTASPGVFHLAVEQLARDLAAPLAEARAQADVVIVTPHWGANWREAPTDAIRAAAHALIDQGADAVLGHSAHILQGIELRHGRPIVYDMGTLLFDRVGQDRMSDAALFELELSADGVHGLTLHPLRLSEGQAHPATGEDARRIRERVAGLTRELDPEIAFDALDESLCLDCTPVQRDCPVATNVGTIPIRELRADAPPSLPATWRGQPANLIYATLPVDCGWTHRVAINNDIEVLGARFASPVRPGYGFVCEVYFRASAPPMPSRVEARLVGLDAHGEAAFSYTHPVAEGICPTSRWNRNAVICDRVLVRPGKELAPGRYTLSWQLIDRDKHISIVVTGRDERLVGGRVVIGQFEVSRNAPRGVAGIARPLRLPRADARFPHRAWQADPIRYWMAQVRPWALRALTFSNVRAAREGTVVEVVRNNP